MVHLNRLREQAVEPMLEALKDGKLRYAATKYFPALSRIGSREFIEDVFDAESKPRLSKMHFSIQLYDAIEFYNEVNRKKFNYLLAGAFCLTLAIVLTATTGIILFVSIG